MRHFVKLLAGALLTAMTFGASSVQASTVVLFEQSGANVTATISGSLNLGTAVTNGGTTGPGFVTPSPGIFSSVFEPTNFLFYTATGPSSFGFGGATDADQNTFNAGIYLNGDQQVLAMLPSLSGVALTGVMTFLNTTLDAIGLDPGSYVFTLDSADTFTIEVATVPVPAGLALSLTALAAVGFMGWRKKKSPPSIA